MSQADSLRAIGMSYRDSMQLAQTYSTLHAWRYIYKYDYAHACYHYGRLLRDRDNPVEAMQCFINATHSRSHDYAILGRIYSNMGSICHLANEYPLSYDMYERSADYFLKNGDTLNYYYALNDMAFELAVQGKKKEALEIIRQIENGCSDNFVSIKTTETKAEVYKSIAQYDSAIYYADKLISIYPNEPLCILIKAFSFSELGMKDSAIFYAKSVLADTLSPFQHRFNALYILSHNDSTLDQNAIREISSLREDIRYYDYEPLKIKLTNAILFLEQDLARKPDLTWLYAIIITLLIISGFYYRRILTRKKQMHAQIEQIMERQSDAIIQSIKQHIDSNDLAHTLHWKNYTAMKADADLYMCGIVSKLENRNLNETEIRFCLLTMLDLSLAQIADTIHYSYPSGIKTLKKRISIKLSTTPQNLRNFLFHMSSNVAF